MKYTIILALLFCSSLGYGQTSDSLIKLDSSHYTYFQWASSSKYDTVLIHGLEYVMDTSSRPQGDGWPYWLIFWQQKQIDSLIKALTPKAKPGGSIDDASNHILLGEGSHGPIGYFQPDPPSSALNDSGIHWTYITGDLFPETYRPGMTSEDLWHMVDSLRTNGGRFCTDPTIIHWPDSTRKPDSVYYLRLYTK
jgi:hypothetical protein